MSKPTEAIKALNTLYIRANRGSTFKQAAENVELENEIRQALEQGSELKELIRNSKTDDITSSVDTGFNVYHNTEKYYLVKVSDLKELIDSE